MCEEMKDDCKLEVEEITHARFVSPTSRSFGLFPFVGLRTTLPSEIEIFSPFVDQLMLFIAKHRGADEGNLEIDLALREALANAIVHGNQEDPRKRVSVKCRCTANGEVSITVEDERNGLRFQRQSDFWKPRWFKPKLQTFQERLGGRIALVSEIDLQRLPIVTYNLHLESRSDDNLRSAQLNEVLHDAAMNDRSRLLILAGDLNLNASKPRVSELLASAGFREAVPTAYMATTPHRHLLEPGRHIDWAFVRGSSKPNAGRVLNTVKASDHYPISFELRLSQAQQKITSSGFMSFF